MVQNNRIGVVEYYSITEIASMVKDLHIKIEGVSFRTKEVSGYPVNEMVLKVRQNEVDSD